jgi:hypothetical protein
LLLLLGRLLRSSHDCEEPKLFLRAMTLVDASLMRMMLISKFKR